MPSFYVETDEIVWHESLLANLLNALTTIPGTALLATPKVRLYTGTRTPDPRDDDPTGLTAPVFTGYSAQTATPGTPVNINGYGKGRVIAVTYTVTTSGAPEQMTGWVLTDDVAGAATKIYAEGQLTDDNIVLQDSGDHLSLEIILPIEANQSR